jgi:hypothetical protein
MPSVDLTSAELQSLITSIGLVMPDESMFKQFTDHFAALCSEYGEDKMMHQMAECTSSAIVKLITAYSEQGPNGD